jgi:hypothetical protein
MDPIPESSRVEMASDSRRHTRKVPLPASCRSPRLPSSPHSSAAIEIYGYDDLVFPQMTYLVSVIGPPLLSLENLVPDTDTFPVTPGTSCLTKK